MLGICWAESDRYADAVGDLALTDAKWGPSLGLPQIRSLRDPTAWEPADRYRDAAKLRDVVFQAEAAWIISKQGTDFTPWSTYRSGAYLTHKGDDFTPRVGHPNAGRWDT